MRCNRVDCDGSIASDGYCDTCGFPQSAAPAAATPPPAPASASSAPLPPPPAGAAPLPSPVNVPGASIQTPDPGFPVAPVQVSTPVATAAQGVGTSCQQVDCSGLIASDGYCTTCGASGANVVRSASTAEPGTVAAPSIAIPTAPATSSRTTGLTRRTVNLDPNSTRTQLGRGLVSVAPTPIEDPATAVMSDEKVQSVLGAVPEDRRQCAKCGRPVGQTEEGEPGRVTGFCGGCRTPFNFVTNTPALSPGEVVAGQYRILGPLAHGGMGWIYLGQDTAVSDRWVVLKGLLNEDDADAIASAVAERQFLAQIEHGNIVNIYNFVTHGGAGYIVMEYVGGESLNSKLKSRRTANNGVPDPLPPGDAIAYILGVLPALGYLHRMGLVYNDMKPANVMATADDVKLIDVGGVMSYSDHDAAIFGTQGFQAPEVPTHGPSVSSDLYTVGRTLAVLMLNFVYHAGEFQYALPNQAQEPLFAKFEALYRFLLKATAPHPDDRFQTADEMADQLTGVLRIIVSATDGRPRPVVSKFFSADRLPDLLMAQDEEEGSTVRPRWRALPMPLVNPVDPASQFLNGLPDDDAQRARELIEAGIADGQIPSSPEVALRYSQTVAETNGLPEATLAQIEAADPWEWRVDWVRGVVALRDDQPSQAAERFSAVWTALPGEIAPKLAVAVAAELAGEYERAGALYQSVVNTDPTYVSASFGLARCRAATGDREGAIGAYGGVRTSSATYVDAQVSMARTMVFDRAEGATTQAADFGRAATVIDRLQLSAKERALHKADILQQALGDLESETVAKSKNTLVFGSRFEVDDVRNELEETYRDLARLAPSTDERAMWVDRANGVRPFSIF